MTSPAPSCLNPKKLLISKWTAVTPANEEKHFVVTKVVEPEPPALQVEFVELESVHSPRSTVMPRRSLTEVTKWRQDWLMRVEPSAHWAVKYPALDLLQRFLATDAE